jgi:hypothetical protein
VDDAEEVRLARRYVLEVACGPPTLTGERRKKSFDRHAFDSVPRLQPASCAAAPASMVVLNTFAVLILGN